MAFTADDDPLAPLDLLGEGPRLQAVQRVPALRRRGEGAPRQHAGRRAERAGQGHFRLAAAYGMEIVAEVHSEALSHRRMSPADVEMRCARIAAGSDGQRRAVELGTRPSDHDALMEREVAGDA